MDSDYQLDVDEVRRRLRETEVVGFYFPFLRRTLLADLRANETDGPLVVVTPMVDSVEERVRSLKKLRPRFPRPASMMLVPWPKMIGGLDRLGVFTLLEERLSEQGGDPPIHQCRTAVQELYRLERIQIRNAITGEGYETLWEREG
jgi:hypothetical protein